jgi:hypothetical protein
MIASASPATPVPWSANAGRGWCPWVFFHVGVLFFLRVRDDDRGVDVDRGRREIILQRNPRSESYARFVIFSITCSFLGAPGRIRTCAHGSGGHIHLQR